MKPDFSGEWLRDLPASRLSAGAAEVQAAVLHIAHREPVFAYRAGFVAGG